MRSIWRRVRSIDVRVLTVFALLAIVGVGAWNNIMNVPQEQGPAVVPVSRVVERARAGEIARILLPQAGNEITVEYRNGTLEKALKEPGSMLEYLQRLGVGAEQMPSIEVQRASDNAMGRAAGFIFLMMLATPITILLVTFLFRLFGRKKGEEETTPSSPARNYRTSDQNQATQFARSKAKVITADRPSTTFANVAGAEEAKEELTEVVDFLRRPDRYAAMGARIPKGILMVGPPGTGKTLLARAVAGEAEVPFLSVSGSEFVEMFVGVGAARVRDMFDQARAHAPCIVFIDEIDAVGRHRATGIGMTNDEREQTLNQILVEMDGFDPRTNIIMVAATNRADVLDTALLRPGRFDRQILLGLPDRKARQEILRVHAAGKPLSPSVDLEVIARLTPGFSGADLENVMNEAALLAVRRDAEAVEQGDLHEAIDRVTAGPRRKGRVIGPRERRVTAYHEAGHAVVAHALSYVDPVQKVTIVSRGSAGGYTRIVPSEDKYLFTVSEFKQTIAWALGGQAAEQMIFGEMSTGAGNDIGRATQIARKMVTEYGMSERLGPVAFAQGPGTTMFGRMYEPGDRGSMSNEVAYEIDQEVRSLLAEASREAQAILAKRRDRLVALAEILIEEETVEGERLAALLEGALPPTTAPQPGGSAGEEAA